MNMDNLIALSVKHNASDLHLCVGQVPVLRVDGELFSQTHCAAVTEDALRDWVKTILDQANYHRLMTKGQADLALFIRDQPLRANIFMAGGLLNAALRLISPAVPSLEDILAPPVFAGLLSKTQSGLILVTGATGQRKVEHAGGAAQLYQSAFPAACDYPGRSGGVSSPQQAVADPPAGDRS